MWTQSWSIFQFFPSVVRGNLGNYSKPIRNYDTVLCRKIWGFFCTYRMKFNLVLQKLWTILLVQEIREPHHADHVIGHLANRCFSRLGWELFDQPSYFVYFSFTIRNAGRTFNAWAKTRYITPTISSIYLYWYAWTITNSEHRILGNGMKLKGRQISVYFTIKTLKIGTSSSTAVITYFNQWNLLTSSIQ